MHTFTSFKDSAVGADRLPVELAALLHDVGDRKLAGREFRLEDHPANLWLLANGVDAELRLQVMEIVLAVSFKGAGVETRPDTLAAQVVQDADRLDAIGALGIARTFAYGGARGQAMHDPGRPPQLHQTAAAYARGSTTSINHFYEKLLLLGERLNTRRAKEIARQRHEFMQNFLRQFLSEWQGEDYLRPGR